MGLDSIIRGAVKTASSVTRSLQVRVQYKAWTASDESGTASYASAKFLRALVEQKQQERRAADGRVIMTRATITILDPMKPNGAAKRVEPIDPRDQFILPDNTTGPIVDISGFIDAGTRRPFLHQVWLG